MASLPHDILMEIMLYLPAKSLMRFRCVSKTWYTQISNSEFLIKFLIQSIGNENPNLFLLTEPFDSQIPQGPIKPFEGHQHILSVVRDGYMVELEGNSSGKAVQIETPPLHKFLLYPPKIVGSVNDLVCLECRNRVYLLNPFTKIYRKLEMRPRVGRSRPFCGFGYDPIEKVNKWVEIAYAEDSNSYITAFSLDNTSSPPSTIKAPYRILNKLESVRGEVMGQYVDGFLYWLARVEDGTTVNVTTDTVISYSVAEKVVREVPLPYSVSQEHYVNLGVVGGKLSMLCKSCRSDTEIWVMMDSSGARNSWCKLFSIGRELLPFRYFCWTRPLCLTKNGGIILKDGRDLVMYDPKQNVVRNLVIQGLKDGMILSEIVVPV